MYKPDNLRQFLVGAIPALARDPDQLSVFIDRGQIVASLAPGLSYEYRYNLNLLLLDFAGDPDIVMAPLVAWLRVHQPESLANDHLRDGVLAFDADLLDNAKVDLSITLALTERAVSVARADGGYDVTHPPEPQVEAALQAGHWQLYVNGELSAEWDTPAV